MKITAVTTRKNEGAFLLEWIAYHKIIGFTDIVILSNDCEDGSDEMLDHLSKSDEIIHLRNDGPYDDRGIQFAALKLADRQTAVKEADWIMHLDMPQKCAKAPRMSLSFMSWTAPKMPCTRLFFRETMSRICAAS